MKVCMQETESVMTALHSVAEAQLSPASRPCVCVCVSRANNPVQAPPSAMSATPATQNDGHVCVCVVCVVCVCVVCVVCVCVVCVVCVLCVCVVCLCVCVFVCLYVCMFVCLCVCLK